MMSVTMTAGKVTVTLMKALFVPKKTTVTLDYIFMLVSHFQTEAGSATGPKRVTQQQIQS